MTKEELFDNKAFWFAMCGVVAFIYFIALVLLALVGTKAGIVRLALVMLVVHAFEVPMAMKRLAGKNPDPARLIPLTLVFGAAWWLPAQRGLFPVR
jgi:hypothetical protein